MKAGFSNRQGTLRRCFSGKVEDSFSPAVESVVSIGVNRPSLDCTFPGRGAKQSAEDARILFASLQRAAKGFCDKIQIKIQQAYRDVAEKSAPVFYSNLISLKSILHNYSSYCRCVETRVMFPLDLIIQPVGNFFNKEEQQYVTEQIKQSVCASSLFFPVRSTQFQPNRFTFTLRRIGEIKNEKQFQTS